MKKLLKILAVVLVLAAAGGGGFYAWLKLRGGSDTVAYNKDGTYVEEEIVKDVLINASNVELRNKSVEGTITIRSDGAHDILLRNVAVDGDIVIEKAKQEYTLILSNVSCRNIKIDSEVPVNVKVADSSAIQKISTNASITVTELLDARSQGAQELEVTSEGNVNVTLHSAGLDSATMSAPSAMIIDGQSMVEVLTINYDSSITNDGEIGLLNANANTTYLREPKQIAVKEGVVVMSNDDIKEAANTTTTTTTRRTSATTTTTTPVTTTTTKTTTKKTTKATTPKPTTKVTTTTQSSLPLIVAEDLTVTVGDKVNLLQGVSCTDKEDGTIRLTNNHIKSNDLNMSQPGVYTVIYEVSDKDGNRATKTRKITVKEDTSRLNAPTNVRYSFDKEGAMRLVWDAVGGAYDYTVYINNKAVIDSTTNTSAYIENYINLSKPNNISVVAFPSPTSTLKESVGSTLTYTYPGGNVVVPDQIHAGVSTSVDFEFEPLHVSTRAVNRVRVTLEKYVNREYVPVSGYRMTSNRLTDSEGQVMISNYARGSMTLNPVFKTAGSYRLTLELVNDDNLDLKIVKLIDVYNFDGTINSNEGELEIDDFTGEYRRYSSWDISLAFTMPYDLDLEDASNDISIAFYYSVNGEGDNLIYEFNRNELGYRRKTIYANTTQRVTISNKTSEIHGTSFDDYLYETMTEEDSVSVYAIIKIVENDQEKEYTTREIRFN